MACNVESDSPEYLINQSTHTCLTVISGNGVHDAVIGLAKCSSSIKQQWFFVNGILQWGGNRTLCLAPHKRTSGLCLQPCSAVTGIWIHDVENRLIFGSQALDVPWQTPRTQVLLYPKHDGVNQKWWTLSKLKACLAEKVPKQRSSRDIKCHCHGQDFMVVSPDGEIVYGDQADASPEFLVNRSTLTCLTVMNGTNPSSATIALSPFSGDISQQWIVTGGRWQWAGNLSYCLDADLKNGVLILAHSNNSKTSWTFDNDGIMGTMKQALDVPWEKPRTRVIIYPRHGGDNQQWWKLSDIRTSLKMSSKSRNEFPKVLVKMAENIPRKATVCECHHQAREVMPGTVQEEAKYLVSQSTRTCLSVLSGTGPSDAVIGLAPYTGDVKHHWFVKEGQWQWGGNRSYCLVPDPKNGRLSLASSNDATTVWIYDGEGLFRTGHHALDVPWEGERTKVILYPKHGGLNQKWWLHSVENHCVANNLYPFSANDDNLYKQEVARGIVNRLCSLSDPLPHPRDVTHYPGTVPQGTPRINLSCNLRVGTVKQAKNLRMTVPEDWQATNMYVVAGDIFKVILPDNLSEKQAQQITVRVGAHCDCLDPSSPNVKNTVFKRMPVLSEEFEVNPGVNTLRSQYGGNLIFTYEGDQSFQVKAEVQNIVETAYYILGKTSTSEWNRMKGLRAPFSVLETNKVVLIVPTSEAKAVSDLEGLLHRYNGIIEKLEDLAGFTANDPPPQGKQWLVDDVQIAAGSAHAGFPAMFDHQYYDLTSPETPHDWVVWHELGHNYQQAGFWSYAYGSESTVNLFSLFIEEKIKEDDRLKRENKYMETAESVDKGLTFEKADCWEKLVFLMEIKHSFPNHGWDMYRHLNRTIRALSAKEASVLCSNIQNQYDHVYKTLSCYIGVDLLPHYQRWGLNVSQRVQKEVSSLHLPKSPRNLLAKAHPDQCIIT